MNASGHTVQVPLQPGAYWALPHGSPGQYQVVERTCAALSFGYINTPFIWTKVVKVLARAMRARGIRCLWFIDDCLLALPSRPLALLARKTVEDLFVRSDLTRAPDKGLWVPTQTDYTRSPWCGDFDSVNHRLDQGPPTTFYLRAAISDCLLIGFIRATETLRKN